MPVHAFSYVMESFPEDAPKLSLDVIHQANANTPSGTLLDHCFSTSPKALSSGSFSLLIAKSQHTFKLRHYRGNRLPPDLAQSILGHVRSSLRCQYDKSRMKWDDSEKLTELTHPYHHIITASSPSIPCAAFVCFRFDTSGDEDDDDDDDDSDDDDDDVEEQRPVTYVYEVFTHPDVRGLGIASSLMNLVEFISRFFRIPTVMLTVFESNTAALSMYKRFK